MKNSKATFQTPVVKYLCWRSQGQDRRHKGVNGGIFVCYLPLCGEVYQFILLVYWNLLYQTEFSAAQKELDNNKATNLGAVYNNEALNMEAKENSKTGF